MWGVVTTTTTTTTTTRGYLRGSGVEDTRNPTYLPTYFSINLWNFEITNLTLLQTVGLEKNNLTDF